MNKHDYDSRALALHKKHKGKLAISSSVPLKTKTDLAIAYTPGVGAVCKKIATDKKHAYAYTTKANTVAVVSDGSAVLGLGNIGPEASMPVMEGKAIIFKTFAGLDAWPIVLDVHDAESIVSAIKAVAPGFGAINLEDIAAPTCFEVERALHDVGIPVMHDDQHGTAIIAYAALLNALKIAKKNISDITVVINGAGAAGLAIARMFANADNAPDIQPVGNILLCDSKGIVSKNRTDLNPYKKELLPHINKNNMDGMLEDAMKNADMFLGVSKAGLVGKTMVRSMNTDPIIFALANPIPEIYPDDAKAAGARVVATGRSDFPNQINNALVFPGIFKGALEAGAKRITPAIKYAAAHAIAKLADVKKEELLPSIFDKTVVPAIVKAVKKAHAA